LADDEASIRDFAAQALERFGYRVRTAATGEEALEVFAPAPGAFDLVLLDIGMPGMGGRKCLREMRRLDPSAKVLICSGYTTNGHVQEALDQGAAGFVNKPYELTNLLENVRRVLDEPA
jgi:DNA-binding NtrC family response regulator